jgi:hypothetical protein
VLEIKEGEGQTGFFFYFTVSIPILSVYPCNIIGGSTHEQTTFFSAKGRMSTEKYPLAMESLGVDAHPFL